MGSLGLSSGISSVLICFVIFMLLESTVDDYLELDMGLSSYS